jgi:formylglycine-generating enzyme required for sulfatase activity
VSDDNHAVDRLEVAWSVDGSRYCDWQTPTNSGVSTCDIALNEGTSIVVAEVRDPRGAISQDSVALSALSSEPPVLNVVSPSTQRNYYVDVPVLFAAIVSDQEDAPEDLVVSWSSDVDGDLALDTTVNANGESADSMLLTQGSHTISVTVQDGSGKEDSDTIQIVVGDENHVPTCGITEPLEGSSHGLGVFVPFRAVVDDEDIPNGQLNVEWSSDVDGVFDTGSPGNNGNVFALYNGLSLGEHVITMQVTDDAGVSCSDQISLSIGYAPEVTIDHPLQGGNYGVGEALLLEGTVSDMEEAAEQLQVFWISDVDGEIYRGNADVNGHTSTVTDQLSPGNHLISLIAVDGLGVTASDVVAIHMNHLPVVDSIAFQPDPVFSTDELTMTFSVSDADNQQVTSSIEWYENGLLTTFTGTTIPTEELQVDEEWTVRITPNDGVQEGHPVEASIVVSNTSPVVYDVSITPNATVYNDTILTCMGSASDVDQSITPDFQWTINGTIYTGAVLDLATTPAMPNYVIACNGIATDDQGATDMGTVTVVVENRPPELGTVTITPSSDIGLNDVLTCHAPVSDPDGEVLAVSYVWRVNGFQMGAGDTLGLTPSLMGPGDIVQCIASTADNYGGTDTASTTVSIANEPPTIDSATLTPAYPNVHDTLLCAATASDVDSSNVTLSFEFINVTTGTIYYPTSFADNYAELNMTNLGLNPYEEVMCTITATDSNGATDVQQFSTIVSPLCTLTDCDLAVDVGSTQPEFVTVASGSFEMGSPSTEVGRGQDETPYTVQLTEDIWVMTTEVTQGTFFDLLGYDAADGLSTGDTLGSYGVGSDYPAYHVNWHMAADLANAMTVQHNVLFGSNLQACYSCTGTGVTVMCTPTVDPYLCSGYRMLTESEWEYTARAGMADAYWTPSGGRRVAHVL